MAIDKLTPRYLNKDSDERLVKNVEMTDALNLRISTEDDGDGIVIKNAYGNVAKGFNIAPASGTSKVVGSVSHEQLGVIIFFIYNLIRCFFRNNLWMNRSVYISFNLLIRLGFVCMSAS